MQHEFALFRALPRTFGAPGHQDLAQVPDCGVHGSHQIDLVVGDICAAIIAQLEYVGGHSSLHESLCWQDGAQRLMSGDRFRSGMQHTGKVGFTDLGIVSIRNRSENLICRGFHKKKGPEESRAFVSSIEAGLNSPYRPYRPCHHPCHRQAYRAPHCPSSAFRRPWLPW
jgi:hypothetical protein